MNILTQNYINRKIDELNSMRLKGPFSCGEMILSMQEELILKISDVERKIKNVNKKIEDDTKELKIKEMFI